MTCSICTEILVQPIECFACRYVACCTCTQQYILSHNTSAQCMNPPCHVPWSLKFMHNNFEEVWLNGPYRDHFSTLLTNREKSKIPETVTRLSRLQKEHENDKLISDLQARVGDLESQLTAARENLQRVQAYKKSHMSLNEIPRFLCPCPYPDCRGLIEIITFQCGVCNGKICQRCRNPVRLGNPHQCDDKDVETLKLLSSDTKPCPKCLSPIYKIDGCDQMWCTKCQTPFNWGTGEIVTGTIHNPHAIRWQREHGGLQHSLRDVPCGGLVNLYLLRRLPADNRRKIQKIHRRIAEIEDILRTPYLEFGDLRSQFVLNEITEAEWKHGGFIREESNMRKKINDNVFQLLQVLSIERFRDLAHNIRGKPSKRKMGWAFNIFMQEIEQIRALINTTFKEESAGIGFLSSEIGLVTPPYIEETWEGQW